MTTPFPTGWIAPEDRNREQNDAHFLAESRMVAQFALAPPTLEKGKSVVLTQFWKHADVVADLGRPFIRELQNTGSCVKVGGTNALRCTIATQRLVSEEPTKAFEPFTWHNYAMSRHYFGDDGRGEGSMGSTFFKSLGVDGLRDWPQDAGDKLPDYKQNGEHISITGAQELEWSSYRNPNVQAMLAMTREHLLGTAGICKSVADIKAMVLNGYGVAFACDNYVADGSIRGTGADAYVKGRWNGRGGHQQWVFGAWEHPNDGTLYAVGNNWPDNTYPKDPAGLPLCCLWVSEADVAAAMRLNAEVYGYSHLSWFPAQPKVLDDWSQLF